MNANPILWRRLFYVAAATIATVIAFSCADNSVPTGLDPLQSVAGDTVPGTGQLAELQQHRTAWLARKIDSYQFELRISCFCGSEITRPVLIEVRQGTLASVTDIETNKPVTNKFLYPTITALFDNAIAERSRGGNVSVSYDRALGIPARLEVGTIANDAGVLYFVSAFVASR